MLTTAGNMLNDALSTYTYDAENRFATAPPCPPHVLFVPVDGGERDVELSGGVAGADEVEGGGDGRGLGMGADGAPGHLRVSIARRDVCMSEGVRGIQEPSRIWSARGFSRAAMND